MYTLNSILLKIQEVKAPEHWEVEQPNQIAKDNAVKVCEILFEKHKILPDTIVATVEHGVYLSYGDEDKYLSIETYNEGEICGVVCDKKKKEVLSCNEVTDFNFDKLTKIYLEKD